MEFENAVKICKHHAINACMYEPCIPKGERWAVCDEMHCPFIHRKLEGKFIIMKIKEGKEEEFKKGLEVNKDSYGAAIYAYTQRWAGLMEIEIENSDKTPEEVINECAEKLSHDADTEGISGFMYGAAVSILAQCWEYGDILRKWHNKEYNYEGEGVVNPAVINIGE